MGSRSSAVIASILLLSVGQAQNRPKQLGGTAVVPGTTGTNPQDGLEYTWIPPGTFQMGCSVDDKECRPHEMPAHTVTVTKGFWMGKTEVTVGAYMRFVRATGHSMPPEPVTEDGLALNKGWRQERQPIVQLTWNDAGAYCAWAGGRLPTEAEWEYAARAGTAGSRYGVLEQIGWFGDTSGNSLLDTVGIMAGRTGNLRKQFLENRNRLHDVAQNKPNAFGLYDVLGNAWEWVEDWYDAEYYSHSPVEDPPGPSTGQSRISRGGAWNSPPYHVRVSDRIVWPSTTFNVVFGGRCVAEHL